MWWRKNNEFTSILFITPTNKGEHRVICVFRQLMWPYTFPFRHGFDIKSITSIIELKFPLFRLLILSNLCVQQELNENWMWNAKVKHCQHLYRAIPRIEPISFDSTAINDIEIHGVYVFIAVSWRFLVSFAFVCLLLSNWHFHKYSNKLCLWLGNVYT